MKEQMSTSEIIDTFHKWQKAAKDKGHPEPTAVTLSTVDRNGFPSSRVVLCKKASPEGFVFYTNLTSQKANEIARNPRVCLNFMWHNTHQQIRVQGIAEQVSDDEADDYFASRAKMSQIGAWASKQSKPIEKTMDFEKRLAKYTAKFNFGKVPRPEFWSGFLIRPHQIEFWQMRDFRLHERFIYSKSSHETLHWSGKKHYP